MPKSNLEYIKLIKTRLIVINALLAAMPAEKKPQEDFIVLSSSDQKNFFYRMNYDFGNHELQQEREGKFLNEDFGHYQPDQITNYYKRLADKLLLLIKQSKDFFGADGISEKEYYAALREARVVGNEEVGQNIPLTEFSQNDSELLHFLNESLGKNAKNIETRLTVLNAIIRDLPIEKYLLNIELFSSYNLENCSANILDFIKNLEKIGIEKQLFTKEQFHETLQKPLVKGELTAMKFSEMEGDHDLAAHLQKITAPEEIKPLACDPFAAKIIPLLRPQTAPRHPSQLRRVMTVPAEQTLS